MMWVDDGHFPWGGGGSGGEGGCVKLTTGGHILWGGGGHCTGRENEGKWGEDGIKRG
jgi:hypothetical protein